MRFVIVTGMSGSGKRTVLKMLEDSGFYCVDNLPVPLIEKFIELIAAPNGEIQKAALGLDVRADQSFDDAQEILEKLKAKGYVFELLFMDASNETLLKRYKESRRMHPLSTAQDSRVEDGINKERMILEDVKKQSDYVIDTSKLLTRELKEELDRIFLKNEEYNSLMVSVVSFGFKNGIPADADLVFDVRFLPNPFYIEELKAHTGNDRCVQDYVMSFPEAEEFLKKLLDMLYFLIPCYVKEGKYQLVIAIGCTGGKHRSVTLANELYKRMKNQGNFGMNISHRDTK
jgi:RNase adapter protein RapZ